MRMAYSLDTANNKNTLVSLSYFFFLFFFFGLCFVSWILEEMSTLDELMGGSFLYFQ